MHKTPARSNLVIWSTYLPGDVTYINGDMYVYIYIYTVYIHVYLYIYIYIMYKLYIYIYIYIHCMHIHNLIINRWTSDFWVGKYLSNICTNNTWICSTAMLDCHRLAMVTMRLRDASTMVQHCLFCIKSTRHTGWWLTYPSEKIWKSVGMMKFHEIPNMMGKIIQPCFKPPTSIEYETMRPSTCLLINSGTGLLPSVK